MTEGQVTVDGRSPGEAAGELAFVFQEATLLPWLTVAGNVEVPLRLRGVPAAQRAEARRRVLELVRLADRAARLMPCSTGGPSPNRLATSRNSTGIGADMEPEGGAAPRSVEWEKHRRSSELDEASRLLKRVGTASAFRRRSARAVLATDGCEWTRMLRGCRWHGRDARQMLQSESVPSV